MNDIHFDPRNRSLAILFCAFICGICSSAAAVAPFVLPLA